MPWGVSNIATKNKLACLQIVCFLLVCVSLVLLLCVFALLACSNRKHRNQKHTCLFADRLFLAGLFLVRLMYRVCIADMPFRHFLEHCFSDKKSKQVTIQNAMCFLLVCVSVGFSLLCFCFARMFKS